MSQENPAPSKGKAAVYCRGLTKSYGVGAALTPALRGCDLEVRYGELLMLIGPSGSGKTTLLSIIGGIMDQDGGDCLVLDHDFQREKPTQRAEFRGSSIGFVFQTFNLIPSLTVAENVAVPLLIKGVPRKDATVRALRILDRLELPGRAEALPTELSGGQQQRVAIARALVHGPRLILCDEPTSNLDHAVGRQVMELLRREAMGAERAVIVVTHDPRIFDFADRIARMDDGRIVEITDGSGREAGS